MVFVRKTPSKKFHFNLKKWKACPPPLDSLSLFPLFTLPFPVLWNFIFIFFYLYVFIFLVFNLLIGAKTEVVNCALSKKSKYSLFCHSHFIKEKKKRKERASLFEGLYLEIFVEVGLYFPTFKLQTQ